jgi:hypothetical protein
MLCMGLTPVHAEHPNAALALRLVSAMGVDLQMARGVQSIGEQMFRSGQLDEVQRECLRGVGRGDFTGLLQEAATRELSAPELRAAVDYFESSAGKKDLGIAQFRRFLPRAGELGLRMPDLSPDEYDQMRAFGASPAGVKLLGQGVLTGSTPASDYIVRKTRELIGGCKNAH